MTQPGLTSMPVDDPARELAADLVGRLADGESLDVAELAARLPDADARRRCLDLVQQARRVQELLPQPLRPGVALGQRYRVGRELGAGGMGRVFEAQDLRLPRRVAVKVLTALGGLAFDAERQFFNEAAALAELDHPNIVRVHEYGTHEGQPFLVLDLVDGTPLDRVIDCARSQLQRSGAAHPRDGALLLECIGRAPPAGRRAPPAGDDWFRAVARLMLDLARTVEAAHVRRIVHRDLKPQNVLLRGDATPVVLDFGLAGTLDRAGCGVSRTLFGTGAYLAPEQVAAGKLGTDPLTDVYQLGLLLYELLVLERAFPGEELKTLLDRVGRGQFKPPRAIDRGVPAELEAICLKAMELDPRRRYRGVQELRLDLQRWVEEGLPPKAARGGRLAAGLRRSRSFARRNRVTVAVTCTAATALLAWSLFRPPAGPWIGDLVALRIPAGSSVAQEAPDFSNVAPDDTLGVKLNGRTPAYVYALSVFGFGDPHQFVAPMVVQTEAERGVADVAPADWGRLVQPGESVACTHVGVTTPDGQHEGLLLFASTVPQPRLSDWMNELQRRADEAPNHAVSWVDARNAVEPSVPRGERVHLGPQEQDALQRFSAAALLGDETWALPDPRRWEFSFIVRR